MYAFITLIIISANIYLDAYYILGIRDALVNRLDIISPCMELRVLMEETHDLIATVKLPACMHERELWEQLVEAIAGFCALYHSYCRVSLNSALQWQSPDFCCPSSSNDLVSRLYIYMHIYNLFVLKIPRIFFFSFLN